MSAPTSICLHPSKLGAATLLCMLLSVASTVAAQVQIEGSTDEIRVDASRASLADVLTALGTTQKVRLRTAVELQSEISGSYSGTLPKVLARLLAGYNYVLTRRDWEVIEVVVIGVTGERAVIANAPVIASTPGIAAISGAASPANQWRATPKGPSHAR